MIKIPVRVSSDLSPLLAAEMAKSVRQHMRDVELIHIAESGAPKLDCFDSIMHVDPEGDYVEQLLKVMAMIDGNVLSLDYDILLREDVSDVFSREFDVAFTRRPESDPTVAKKLQDSYNMGVIFSKGCEFWKAALALYRIQPVRDGWLGSQSLASQIAVHLSDRFKLVELPGEQYNHTPQTRDEDLTGRKIVHYKGKRKAWMLPEHMAAEADSSIRKTVSMIKKKPDAEARAN